jgi:hypothetical protein
MSVVDVGQIVDVGQLGRLAIGQDCSGSGSRLVRITVGQVGQIVDVGQVRSWSG